MPMRTVRFYVAEALVAALGRGRVENTSKAEDPHEAHLLTLDCSKARARLGWKPRLDFDTTIAMTADWYLAWTRGADMALVTKEANCGLRISSPVGG